MNKIAFISGATSGIGLSCVYKFASNGYRVILCGRRSDRLSQNVAKLVEKYGDNFYAISLDVRNRKDVEKAIQSLPDEWKNIDVLVNNAGLALGLAPIQDGNVEHWEQMIDTNIKGLLYLSKAIIPNMIERRSGHIINVGSIAGREAYPNGNVYCATKAAVDSLTKNMRIDLLKYGIKVSQVAPGAADTEFSLVRFEGDKDRADNVYKGYTPLSGDDIADVIYYLASLPPHVNINDVLVMCTAQASASIFNKV